jgi:hypothetical protein
MASVQKCANCGLDLTDTSALVCPVCRTPLVARPDATRIWIAALVQLAISTTFMLIFHFPKIMIVIFGGVILIGTLVSLRTRMRPASLPAPQAPVTNPILSRVLSVLTAIFGFAFVCFLLFGSVIFLNNWNAWHRYEGQPYHRSTFEVRQVYYQKLGKGGVDLYANGNVEGQKEWMSLRPYIGPPLPRSLGELQQRIPAGSHIEIYLFPEMKGRSRIRAYSETPPAEDYHRTAIKAVNYGLGGVAGCAAIIFLLTRLRRMCFGEIPLALQPGAQS